VGGGRGELLRHCKNGYQNWPSTILVPATHPLAYLKRFPNSVVENRIWRSVSELHEDSEENASDHERCDYPRDYLMAHSTEPLNVVAEGVEQAGS